MIIRTFFLLLLGAGMMLSSCSGDNSAKFDIGALKDSLQGEIMAVHDDVMPKHIEIQKLKKELDSRIDSLKSDSLIIENMKRIASLLDSAYHSMNKWMYEYEPMGSEMTKEEILEYYAEERAKIDSVRTLMLESLNQAQDILMEEE